MIRPAVIPGLLIGGFAILATMCSTLLADEAKGPKPTAATFSGYKIHNKETEAALALVVEVSIPDLTNGTHFERFPLKGIRNQDGAGGSTSRGLVGCGPFGSGGSTTSIRFEGPVPRHIEVNFHHAWHPVKGPERQFAGELKAPWLGEVRKNYANGAQARAYFDKPIPILDEHPELLQSLLSGRFAWKSSAPLLAPADRPEDPCLSVKDPTVVRFDDRWHLFYTIRSRKRTHQIEYCSFPTWEDASKAERHVLKLSDGYFCAPQVFYFTPQKKWYLLYQVNEPARKVALQPAFSTSDKVADPTSWSKPTLLFNEHPDNVRSWIDFWIICDEEKAHLFFTSNDGRMWRSETKLADFPTGWRWPRVVLRGDIFEASHTYLLKGMDRYLTLVEAQGAGGQRYYKAYLAERLDGEWKPLAATREQPFADHGNVYSGEKWSDSISHGELLRVGHDERLEVDPARLQFLYQGVSDAARKGKVYGDIPWRLGLLTSQTMALPPDGR